MGPVERDHDSVSAVVSLTSVTAAATIERNAERSWSKPLNSRLACGISCSNPQSPGSALSGTRAQRSECWRRLLGGGEEAAGRGGVNLAPKRSEVFARGRWFNACDPPAIPSRRGTSCGLVRGYRLSARL